MLFSILFVLAFLAQRTLVGACEVCGAAGYAPTLNTQIYVGSEYFYCNELVSLAAAGKIDANACPIVQSYALAQCGCQNIYRSPLPLAPIDLANMCNICGGQYGSNFHAPAESQWNANVGSGAMGITATCGFFFQTAVQGAFGGPYDTNCHTLQESTRAICSCGGVGVSDIPPPAPTPPPPTVPYVPPPPPPPTPPPVSVPASTACIEHLQPCYARPSECCNGADACQLEFGEMATCW